MYKNITTISKDQITTLGITAREKVDWIDATLRNKSEYVLPVKTRMPLKEADYFNVMPCALPSENVLGLKVVTRNENRRNRGLSNIEGDILLYSYDDFLPLALIDGAHITTMRTAAVCVHSLLNFAKKRDVIALVGLGQIGTEVGNILFELIQDEKVTIKLYRYKDQAEKFIDKFAHYSNLTFVVCDTYEELFSDSDVIVSCVTYIDEDFCSPFVFKKECTVIPVHLRGFKKCDATFDHVITSDLVSIQKFENYSKIKKLSLLDDIYAEKTQNDAKTNGYGGGYSIGNQILIYNLGLAVYDLFYASKIYQKIKQNE